MNNIFVAFSIVGAAAAAPAMAAAAPYTVHGSVLDAMTAETLPGASCAFYAANDTVKPLLTLMTGADGSFTADLPRPGEYLMKVTLVSQKPVSRSLVLTDENPAVDLGTIAMQPEGEALEEVVITGRRPVIEATGDKVAYNLTEDPNTQTHTVLEMLRKVPMVTVDAQDNIYINGQSNFKIYLNGKEDPMLGQNASTILKSLPATSIKRIEVILDPGAKYDAEGVGGILNIITETQASTDGQMATITVGGGADNAQASVYGMAKKNKVTASVDVSYYKRFGYREGKGGIERETFDVPSPTVTRQEIAQRQNNHFVNGNARLSWEPNDKNLFTISASGYGGGGKNHYRTTTDVFGDNGLRLSHSRQKLTSKWIWSSITVNAGYQHNFDDKGQNLVLSYQYVGGWNKDKDRTTTLESSFDDFVPYTYDYTNAPTNEHTVQLDYTKPFSQYFTLEAGAKGIFRRNTSDGYTKIGDSWSDMTLTDHNTVDMTQNQDVAAAYATYAGTFGRFSLRAGLRYEYTRMRVDFKTEGYDSFHSNFNDWVPNASLGYSFTPTQNLYASYQQRIRRPGVSELNPHRTEYIDGFVSQGNPDLGSEKSHTVALAYSSFAGKLGFNLRTFYTFSNNRISRYSYEDAGDLIHTYANVGNERDWGLSAFVKYQVNGRMDFSVNATAQYAYLRFRAQEMQNHGWTYSLHANYNYSMPWQMYLNVYGGFSTRRYDLQGYSSGFNYHGIGLTKAFLKGDRVKLTLSGQNFLNPSIKFRMVQNGANFHNNMSVKVSTWDVSMTVAVTLGGLNTSVRKTAKAINNDDVQQSKGGGGGLGN